MRESRGCIRTIGGYNNHMTILKKEFKSAPLPFVGQKRNFIKHFKEVLTHHIPDQGEGWEILDVFGGSGLLAHVAKKTLPNARVLYNDFDNYSERLKHIEETNKLAELLRQELAGVPRDSKIEEPHRSKVVEIIQEFGGTNYIDFACLRSWLYYSARVEKLGVNQLVENFKGKTFYNGVIKKPYPLADGYLEGLSVVIGKDWEEFINLPQERMNRLLILDPPYIQTSQEAYNNNLYFSLGDFLRVTYYARPPFVMFGSTRSELGAYFDFLEKYRSDEWERFKDIKRISVGGSLSKGIAYEDFLYYAF